MNRIFENFQFTLRQREEVIRGILAKKQDDSMSPQDIRLCWSDFLKDQLPPCPWVALIKPNKVVDVLNVEWLQFKATIEAIDEGQDSKREECHLKDLFPMKVDDEEKAVIEAASKALDHFRFFIAKLWFPWDDDDELNDDNEEDWLSEHLALRLMALNENDDEEDLSETFMKLKTLGRHYQETNEKLLEGKVDDMKHQFNLEQKLQSIAKMANIIENPNALEEYKSQLRQAKEKERLFDLDRGYSIDRQAVLVWHQGGTMTDLQEFLDRVKKQIPFDDPHIVFKNTLQDAIDCCVPNDFIVLGPGEHDLHDLGDLSTCLNIVGIGPDPRKIRVNLDCGFGSEMIFDGPASRCCLNNIALISKTFQNGIWIKNGAGLLVKDCLFVQCNTAIKVSGDDSNAKLKWTDFQTCQVAVEAEKGAKVSVSGGLIEDCHVGILSEDNLVQIDDLENYATIGEKAKLGQIRVTIEQV